MLQKYPEGKEVAVYYDKSDPEFSALDPNIVGYEQLNRAIIFLFLSVISLWLVAFIGMKFNVIWKGGLN